MDTSTSECLRCSQEPATWSYFGLHLWYIIYSKSVLILSSTLHLCMFSFRFYYQNLVNRFRICCMLNPAHTSPWTNHEVDKTNNFMFTSSLRYIPTSVQTGFVVKPASYPLGKAAGREADHSTPSSAEVENGKSIILLPHMSSLYSA
jgi:hypothetical protein